MADLADHAYAHAVAVLGSGEPALDVAVVAVRRGGRSRSAVLGHARAGALASPEALAAELDGPVPEDLTDLAVALAATRPPIERVVADLDGRHGLDRGGLGRALGTSTAGAATRVAEVAATWESALDPVVLARLGPGGCDGLAAVLVPAAPLAAVAPGGEPDGLVATAPTATAAPAGDGAAVAVAPGPATLRELLALGPGVAEHLAGCAVCSDRRRAMVSVRTLLAQRPLEAAPHAVRAAAAPSRLRRPSPPPPLEPVGTGRRWARPIAVVVAALLVALAGGVAAAALRDRRDDATASKDLAALTRVPAAGSALVASPATVQGARPAPVRLTNHAAEALTWTAVPDVEWLSVTPAAGRLAPGASTTLTLRIAGDAPEGELRGSLQVSGREGSATVVRVEAAVEHPPDVAATIDGCTVSATVEDEGEVAAVELHWYEPTDAGTGVGGAGARSGSAQGRASERIAPLTATTSGYTGQLPSLPSSVPWWVVAADARGNRARTADAVLAPGACTAP